MPFPSSTLADLIDAPSLQSLMNDFYEIARIPMAIIDIEGRVLVGAGWQDICTKFHRVNPQTCKACIESDTELSAGVPPGEFRRYRCKNNMWDLATPIVMRGRHIGNVFSGQFFFEDETIDYEVFREQARRYRFDERGYIAALDQVPRLSREAVDRGLAFFVKLAHMVSQLGDTNLTLGQAIADRDAITRSLAESEADLAHAQAVAQTGSWRLDVRRDALSWSAEAYRMFAMPEGAPLTYETFLARVHPDDRTAVDAAWQAASIGHPYDIQHRIIVGDEVKWVRETAELEFDKQGRLLGGFGTVQDITRHKHAEQALRDSHEVLRTVIDGTTDLVFLKDRNGRYVVMNQAGATMVGKPMDAIIGKSDLDIFPHHIAQRMIEDDRRLLNSGSAEVIEETLEIGGRVRHLLTSKSVCRDSAGAITGIVGIARDVTAAKRMEAELKDTVSKLAEGNRLKDEFLSTLSHELRTPLNAILGWSQLLRHYGRPYAHADRAIDAIARNAEAQARLVEDVLDVSRIITGKLHLRQETVDLAVVIERAVDTVRPAAEAKDLAVTTSLPERAFVVGDPDRLQQVMWNLLSNAVKFNNKGGRIDIVVARVNSHVQVRVADTGIGIAADFLPHMFERFTQHDSSTTRAYGGLGLGLALVRHLVEMHGGTVQAQSPGQDQGAAFTITLPIRAVAPGGVSDAVIAETGAPPLLPAMPSLHGVRVLVVDDDASARELVQTVLADFGAEVIVACTADEGMRRLQSDRPDVLISDIGMPEEDGYTFVRKVRQLPAELGGQVAAIALTAYGHVTDRYLALSAGYDQHIAKPVIPRELAFVVAAAARKAHQD